VRRPPGGSVGHSIAFRKRSFTSPAILMFSLIQLPFTVEIGMLR
jgi:hypothetical protein